MALFLILVILSIFFSLPVVQTKIARKATTRLNKEFGTNITISRVQVSPFTLGTIVKDIYVEDYQKDTLFFIDKLSTSILSISNMMNGRFEFGAIAVDRLLFKLRTYEGEKETNLDVFVDKLDDREPRDPGTPPFFMSSTEIKIYDSKFLLIDENLENTEILKFNNLKISGTDYQILGPEVDVNINALSLLSKRD